MDSRQGEYPQSDQPPASGQYSSTNASVTPSSDYASARSGSYPEYGVPRTQYPDGSQRYQVSAAQNTPGNMVQSSPSTPANDGPSKNHHNAYIQHPSNTAVPVDPSIAQSSPTYPHQQGYPYPHDMPPQYHTPQHMYGRPEYGPPHTVGHYPSPYGHVPSSMSAPQSMTNATRPPGGGHPLSTVYSFVPIPGTHQQKRPRRRYEEIERMYKCGWNGCEKAYGTLNHLNAHVTMQSHGAKRTPEEFKEIRKEWKARKKEEENQKKADDDRARSQVGGPGGQGDGQPQPPDGPGTPQQPSGYPPQAGVRQLPPLGYAPAGSQVPGQYPQPGAPMESMPQYSNGQMSSYYPPQPPYAQNQQM